jgi:hypothetical protein
MLAKADRRGGEIRGLSVVLGWNTVDISLARNNDQR